MNDLFSELVEQLLRHRGKVIGTLLGLLLGWMVVAYGIMKTLFVILCLVIGFFLGGRSDSDGGPGRMGRGGFGRRR